MVIIGQKLILGLKRATLLLVALMNSGLAQLLIFFTIWGQTLGHGHTAILSLHKQVSAVIVARTALEFCDAQLSYIGQVAF